MKKIISLILLSFFMTSYSQKNTSLIEIIANKKYFNQSEVLITGFMSTDFEGTAIYCNIDDYIYRNTKNAVYIYISENELNTLKNNFKNGYVKINGIYNSELNGQFNAFNGGIFDIKSITILSIDNIDLKKYKPIETIRFSELEK